MPKIIHKQKNPFGGTTYLDENFHVIGYGHKDSLGREVLLDKDLRYAGEKRKGLFGEDIYVNKDWKVQGYGHKGLLGNTIITDKDFKYKGQTGKFGQEEFLFLDGDRQEEKREDIYQRGKRGMMSGIVIFVTFMAIIAVMWLLSK